MNRCGICNRKINPNESWIETDCVICEVCSKASEVIE